MPSPDSAGVSESVASETLVCPLDDEQALQHVFERHGPEIAAVILEPIPANNGLLPQREEWLQSLERVTHSNGSLLIFDEVIIGFRMAFGGMAERLGIAPDLVTYGKVIGGGFSVGGYGGKAELMDWVAPTGPVYCRHPQCEPGTMVAGLETLRLLKDESPYEALEQKGETLEHLMQEVCRQHGREDIQLQRLGSLFWGVVHGRETAEPDTQSRRHSCNARRRLPKSLPPSSGAWRVPCAECLRSGFPRYGARTGAPSSIGQRARGLLSG